MENHELIFTSSQKKEAVRTKSHRLRMKYRIITETKQRSRNAKDKHKHRKNRGLKGVRKKLHKKLWGRHRKIWSSTPKANKSLNSEDTEEAHQAQNSTLAPL